MILSQFYSPHITTKYFSMIHPNTITTSLSRFAKCRLSKTVPTKNLGVFLVSCIQDECEVYCNFGFSQFVQ
jgi:hypothetical protein